MPRGDHATQMGQMTEASGDYSTALGAHTLARGKYSTAMGWSSHALRDYTTAFGRDTTASGLYATAMGHGTEAAGDCPCGKQPAIAPPARPASARSSSGRPPASASLSPLADISSGPPATPALFSTYRRL